jgi:hypothetical protein
MENYHLNANAWTNKHNPVIIPKSAYTQSMFGGTLGGLIIRNKLFFFVDYATGRYHAAGHSSHNPYEKYAGIIRYPGADISHDAGHS